MTYKFLVGSILEYCSSINLEGTQKTSDTIERDQNKEIIIIISTPKKFSVTTGRSL